MLFFALFAAFALKQFSVYPPGQRVQKRGSTTNRRQKPKDTTMDAFEINELKHQRQTSGKLYHEFLRRPSMSAGIYELAAGSADPQQPHREDEIYVILEGAGQLRVGSEDRPVGPGSIVYVAAGVEHRFHTITQDLTILVLFAPPESMNS
jgi:mannose-6-phosphate isomerase-like protein (cupin superfamily)